MYDLVVEYTRPFTKVSVKYLTGSDKVEYVACGEVSDEEIAILLAAGGADAPGWTNELN